MNAPKLGEFLPGQSIRQPECGRHPRIRLASLRRIPAVTVKFLRKSSIDLPQVLPTTPVASGALRTLGLLALLLGSSLFSLGSSIYGNLSWTGEAGWRVSADFVHNSDILPGGPGDDDPAPGIESLTINFFDPSGELVAEYFNVVNASPTYTYLSFHFDPVTLGLVEGSRLDIGEDPGYWFEGDVGNSSSFGIASDFYTDEGPNYDVDHGGGSPLIVPEPSSYLLVCLGFIVLMGNRRRKN